MKSVLAILLYFTCLALLKLIEVESTEEILKKPFTFIYFGAADCRYCEAFDPDFEYLSALYNGNDNFQAVKIDGRAQKDLVQLFDVTTFPTLKLYDAKQKQVFTYTQPREVEQIEKFIQEKGGAVPDLLAVKSNIKEVARVEEVNSLVDRGPVLIAFVSRLSMDWSNYYYPGHFYQRLSWGFPDTRFLIVFADEIESELMEKYHVSNIPSLVFVDKSFVKIYNTLSTNQMVNYKITEEKIREFMQNIDQIENGLWFEDLDSLYLHAQGLEYEGHKQRKGGMNVIQSREDQSLNEDEEYALLLANIGL